MKFNEWSDIFKRYDEVKYGSTAYEIYNLIAFFRDNPNGIVNSGKIRGILGRKLSLTLSKPQSRIEGTSKNKSYTLSLLVTLEYAGIITMSERVYFYGENFRGIHLPRDIRVFINVLYLLAELTHRMRAANLLGKSKISGCRIHDWMRNYGDHKTGYTLDIDALIMTTGDIVVLNSRTNSYQNELYTNLVRKTLLIKMFNKDPRKRPVYNKLTIGDILKINDYIDYRIDEEGHHHHWHIFFKQRKAIRNTLLSYNTTRGYVMEDLRMNPPSVDKKT